jgi:hypothetical protein
MTHFVDLEALNLRATPGVALDNQIARLHLGQPVDLLDGPPAEWLRVRAAVDGQAREGFVKAQIDAQPATGFLPRASLRAAVSPAREALVAAAIRQWLRFEKGQGRETAEPFFRFVGEMWQAIGQSLDGRDTDVPWSAAAISFMVRDAARDFPAYASFRFAAAHSRYIHQSIVRRRQSDTSAPFWGHELHEALPQIGDIVARWRETPRDFADAEASDSFKSHTDIIVSISPDFVLALGGNVGNSVRLTRYDKRPSGHLDASQGVIALMVNRAG